MKDRKRVRQSPPPGGRAAGDTTFVQLYTYDITFDPLPDEDYDALPDDWRDELRPVYEEMPEDWGAAIPVLERGLERAPHIPRIWNLLATAYHAVGRYEDANELVDETIERFPDYLFAKINLAHQYLADGEPERVVEMFGWPLLPHVATGGRRAFHYSEVLGFNCVAGLYYLAVGDFESAEVTLDSMEQLDDEHPNTRVVRRRLLAEVMRLLAR